MLLWPQQTHMLALPMNVDQPASHLLQDLLRHRTTVKASYGAPGAKDVAGKNQLPTIRGNVEFLQQCSQRNTSIGAVGIDRALLNGVLLRLLESVKEILCARAIRGGVRKHFDWPPLIADRW